MTRQRWGVVGGGTLGMTLALWLRDSGHDVSLIEASDQLGGLASVWQIGDVTWDRHYHVILNSDEHLLAMLERLGLTDDLRWVETKTGVFTSGRLYSVSNVIEYLKFPALRMTDKMRMAWTVLYASRIRDWQSLERVPVEQWLRRHSGNRAFESFWLPLLRAKLGDNYKITSAAFIWTTIQRLYAARRSGLKKEMFGYVKGGYHVINSRFAEELAKEGVRTLLKTRVSGITSKPEGVEVEVGDGVLQFDRVVVTSASPLAARLIKGLQPMEEARMNEVEYQGIVCASLLSDTGLGGFYVTNVTDEAPFTGVIEMSALVDKDEFGDRALVYLPRYTVKGDPTMSATDDEIRESFVHALTRMFPWFDDSNVEAFRVSRVGEVFPIPTIRYSERVPPMATSLPGIYAVSSAQILNGTLNVNETLQLAARAFPVIVGETTYHPDLLEADVRPRKVPVTV